MTAPTYQSTTATDFGVDATSHSANMPATVNAGDLLLAVVAFDAVTGGINTPTGWTKLLHDNADPELACFAKVATGSEGGTTVDFSTVNSQQGTVQVVRVTGWSGQVADIHIGFSSCGTTTNQCGVTMGKSGDYLFVACQCKSSASAFGATPSGYSNETKSGQNATTGAGLATATLSATGVTWQSFPAWNSTNGWGCFLIGIPVLGFAYRARAQALVGV